MNNLLHGRIAVFPGARCLAVPARTVSLLRAGRLALRPFATALRRFLCLHFLLLLALPAQAAVSLSLASVRHTAVEADDIHVDFETGNRGRADIRIGRLKLAGIEYKDISLACEDFVLDLAHLDCPAGAIRRADTRSGARPPLPFSFSYRFADGKLALAIVGADAVAWSPLIKRLRTWQPEGKVDVQLEADRKRASLSIAGHRLKFSNAAGDTAGEGIDFSLAVDAERHGNEWQWQSRFDWYQGELYVAPWYRRAGVTASALGTLTAQALRVSDAHVELAGLGKVTAGLRWDRARGEVSDWAFVTDRLDLAAAVRDWLQPWLDQSAVPALRTSGWLRFAAAWSDGRWQSFYAGLEDASITDGTDYLHFEGVNATIPWQRGVDSDAEFSVADGRLGALPLGSFRLPLHMSGNEARFERLSIPLLDGRLYVDELTALNGDAGWRGSFSGGIEGVSMPKLSTALALPRMEGSFTARIPRATYADGVLKLGGDLAIDVFDGHVVATGLQVIDPLRPTQRFVADIAARYLDFGMLTSTFSFGRIEGRFDADIHDLELHGWQPERFDARVFSSPGDYPRSISRGALRDISSLGGAAGGAALMASPAAYSERFGYRRIGLGCQLRGQVCEMSGIEPDGQGYLIVEGAGLPRVDVIGYNRRVDWSLLVSRIRAVAAGKSQAVIE